MFKRILITLCIVAALSIVMGFQSGNQDELTVLGGDAVNYQCENGDRIVASYYTLSDSSLNFVKVLMPDEEEYTLPQVLSGSGARYTDEMELTWWIKGDSATVEMRDENGDWQTIYENCCVVSDPN